MSAVLNQELAAALGLPKGVTHATLTLRAGHAPRLHVTMNLMNPVEFIRSPEGVPSAIKSIDFSYRLVRTGDPAK